MSEKEITTLQDEVDIEVAARFGLTLLSIKACREYEKIHGKFHPLSDMHFCHKTALEWYKNKEKKDE